MRKLLLLLGLAAVAFAGCGGNEGDDSVDASSESSEASDDAGTAAGDDAADTEFSGKGSGDFCELARKFEKDFADTGNVDGTNAEKEFKEAAGAIDDLGDEAPGEIKEDIKTVSKAFAQFTDVLEKYDYDFTKIPESESTGLDFTSPEVEAAGTRVEAYFEKVCKIDSDNDGDTDGETGDPTTDVTTGESTEDTTAGE